MSDPGYYDAVATNQRANGVTAIIAMSDALRLAQAEVDKLREAAGKVCEEAKDSYFADNPDLILAVDDLRALLEHQP